MFGFVVCVRSTRGAREWSAAVSHVLFLKSGWLGSLKGLLCIPQKGALSEMDTWLTERFKFAFLPSQPPVLPLSPPVVLQSLWISFRRTVHAGKWCGVLCLGWSAEERRRQGCVAALGPCCLPSFLAAFRSFRVCSGGYFRFIKPQWLKHNARQERGHGWTWTLVPAK